jgi:hypothetical protein
MKLLVNLAKVDAIGAQGSNALFELAVGPDFEGECEQGRSNWDRSRNWIGERLLVVAAALPGFDEGRAPVDEMDVAVVEESEEETAKHGM